MNNPLVVVLVIILVLMLLGGVPALGLYSHGWHTGGLGAVLIIVLLVMLLR